MEIVGEEIDQGILELIDVMITAPWIKTGRLLPESPLQR
jgi:hypothetical protein